MGPLVAFCKARGIDVTTSLAFAGLFVLALVLRLLDPLSSRVVGAEDPFTHMVIVKETVARGFFAGSDALSYPLYPPGMHAFLVTFWVLSGMDLYVLTRFLPPFVGALAVVTIAAVLLETDGPAAALAGGLVAATIPEHVFRTNLLFPTAFDLLLIPLFLLALVRLARGSLLDAVPLGVVGLALTFMHPWATLLLAPIVVGFVLLRLVFPRDAQIRHIGSAVLTLGVMAGLVWWAYAWWGTREFIGLAGFHWHVPDVLPLASSALGVSEGALVLAFAVAVVAIILTPPATLALRSRRRVRRALAVGTALVLVPAAVLLARTLAHDPPPRVDYAAMLGAPAMLLAFAGLAVVPFRRSRSADAGFAIAVVAFPLTAVPFAGNPDYWPHRTVAYLALGVILLAGAGAGALVSGLEAAAARWRARSLPRAAAALAVALVLAPVLVPVGAATPAWYRYYDEPEFAVVQEAAWWSTREDAGAVVLASTWQPNLFVRALGDESRVEWAPWLYELPADERDARLTALEREHAVVLVIVDAHTRDAFNLTRDADPLPGVTKRVEATTRSGDATLYRVT